MLVAKVDRLFTAPARCLLSGLLAIAALGCLFWSGSKGGWLLMLLLSLVAVLRVPFRKSLKIAILSGVLLAGLSGFAWKYVTFFQKGATSVSARFDYWEAAFKTACANPLFGTGPGTFQIPYKALKRPESEMTRLVHNDYLEQASDSGWLGFFTFTAFVVGGMYFAIKPTHKTVPAGQTSTPDSAGKPNRPSPMPSKQRTRNSTGTIAPCSKSDLSEGPDRWWTFSIWLGLLGWALQSLFDFGLYIPALAWPAFTLLGLLLGRTRIASTKQDVAHNLPARHENPVPQRA